MKERHHPQEQPREAQQVRLVLELEHHHRRPARRVHARARQQALPEVQATHDEMLGFELGILTYPIGIDQQIEAARQRVLGATEKHDVRGIALLYRKGIGALRRVRLK